MDSQSDPNNWWLPVLVLTLISSSFLVCGSASAAFTIIATSSVELAQADETGGSPASIRSGGVKPAVIPGTQRPLLLATPTPVVNSAYASVIPNLDIPDGLFFPDKGDSNFDPTAGRAMYAKGNWIVYANTMESILPVPRGWKTIETGQNTYILYSPTEDWERTTIRIRLSVYGYTDDATTSRVPVTEFVKQSRTVPAYSLLKQQILDDNTGYVFGVSTMASGKKRYLLQVFSKYAHNPSGKFFHVYSVFTYQADWAAYYPLIRAMLAHWHALDNTPIPVALPDTLTSKQAE